MIAAVVYKPGKIAEPLVSAFREYFGPEEIAVRGLGNILRYETKEVSVNFIPLKESYEIHCEKYEKILTEGIGRPNVVVSINPHLADPREGIFIHSAGNVGSETLPGTGYTPRTFAPTDPSTIGMLIRAAHYFAEEVGTEPNINIEATHDLPAHANIPYISFEVKGDYHDLAVLSLVAALGKRMKFRPFLTIGMSYYANEFIRVALLTKKVSAYHVPFYMAHHLDAEFIRRLRKEGKIVGVAFGRGVPREKLPF